MMVEDSYSWYIFLKTGLILISIKSAKWLTIVQTTTSHLLFYQLQSTSQPAYDHAPTSAFPQGGGAGEGDTLFGWELRALGSAFVMGGCTSLHAQAHNLLVTLRHPPSVLTVPYPIPPQLLAQPGSHFPPPPLDGDGEDQVECDVWDLLRAKDWMGFTGQLLPSRAHDDGRQLTSQTSRRCLPLYPLRGQLAYRPCIL